MNANRNFFLRSDTVYKRRQAKEIVEEQLHGVRPINVVSTA